MDHSAETYVFVDRPYLKILSEQQIVLAELSGRVEVSHVDGQVLDPGDLGPI
jgi:hypothetical protein